MVEILGLGHLYLTNVGLRHYPELTLKKYLELAKTAENSEKDLTAWRQAVEAGELLLADKFQRLDGIDWDGLKGSLKVS